jgi:ParB-like chromosome segregation protein Spo0J
MKTVQEIPLKQIDIADETFSVNFMPDLQSLRSSIQTVGLIQPVLLRREKIITGLFVGSGGFGY